MEYKGQLFGKVGKSYFPLIKTSEDVDKLEKQHSQMLNLLKDFEKMHGEYDMRPEDEMYEFSDRVREVINPIIDESLHS